MLRSWDFKLQLSKASGIALYLQIAQQIIDEIQLGRLPPSTVMPGTRELAENLNVNRKTVVLTYDELIAQGWLVTESRRGTFVSSRLPNDMPPLNRREQHAVDIATALIPTAKKLDLAARSSSENFIDFSEGMPDSRLIPYEVLSRAFRRALVNASRHNHAEYENPKGNIELRTSIASMLNMERGLHINAENLCVVRGSQMGIFIAARILTQPGDYVIFENLTYTSAREAFKSCGANILHVAIDEHGIQVEEIEKLCRAHRICAVFVTPQHQFPTTATLTPQRRKELLRLAELYDFMIVEDDHDHEFQFTEHPVFPLASDDKAERVIYIGSLSKVLAPGMHIGYLAAPPSFADQCANELALIDRQGNTAIELAISELMDSGEIKRHARRMSKIYYDRRTDFQDLLKSELWPWLDFSLPQSGLAFWLRFRVDVDMNCLVNHALAEKVRFSPGAVFSEDNADVQAIRLGFASLNHKEMVDGIQRIKHALLACFTVFCLLVCGAMSITGNASHLGDLFPESSTCVTTHEWS